jgi:hypothetical protein
MDCCEIVRVPSATVLANMVFPVLAPHHPAILTNYHRPHGLTTLNCRNVETFDATGRRGEAKRFSELFDCSTMHGCVTAEPHFVG